MTKLLKEIVDLSKDDSFVSGITSKHIILAKNTIKYEPKTTQELFKVVCSLNLINAAVKRKEFKNEVNYAMVKPSVSKLLKYILDNKELNFNIEFYIDKTDKCAYIEIFDLQFSFHNITIDERLQNFIDSPHNSPKPWMGIRLQRISSELLDYVVNEK